MVQKEIDIIKPSTCFFLSKLFFDVGQVFPLCLTDFLIDEKIYLKKKFKVGKVFKTCPCIYEA